MSFALRVIAALLILWEPMRFATEALTVFSTIAYRGAIAALELVLHGCVAALCAAAGLALWNASPGARRLATIAIIASTVRTIQALFWSSLPNNTPPGDELPRAALAAIIGTVAMAVIRSSRDQS